MFDIGFPELILIAVVGLLVIGPERLPETLRTLGLWLGRMRRSFAKIKTEIENEIGMDEVRRQLHNESVMEEMKRIEAEVRSTANDTRDALNEATIHQKPLPPEVNQPEQPKPEFENPTQADLELTPATPEPSEAKEAKEAKEPTADSNVEKQADNQAEESSENRPPPASEANG